MIFVDTGFLLAFFSTRDAHHERARVAFDRLRGQPLPRVLVTTDVVVLETITVARARGSHALATFIGERLYSGRMVQVHHTSHEEHLAAFEYFKQHSDKRYSAVDCLSFVIMDKLGIREALAVDEDFTHRFIARPGPR